MTLGTGVRIPVMAITLSVLQPISPPCITYSKGQFLSCHAYMVWEVKDPLSRLKVLARDFSFSFHISYHHHDVTEILLLWHKNHNTQATNLINATRAHYHTMNKPMLARPQMVSRRKNPNNPLYGSFITISLRAPHLRSVRLRIRHRKTSLPLRTRVQRHFRS